MLFDSTLFLWNIIRVIVFTIVTAMLLSNCSPGQRMTTLLKNHPELLKKDSTLTLDSLITPEKVEAVSISDDSLKKTSPDRPFVKDSLGVKTSIYHYNNTTYVKSDCPPDTVVHKHYNVTNNYTTVQHTKTHWTTYLLWAVGGAFLCLFLLRLLKL